MTTVFLICAVLGGTVFVVQFVLTLVGMGGDAFDFDGVGDVDFDVDLSDVTDMQGDVLDHGSSLIFGVLSFRTVVAALTFFGLAGLAAEQRMGESNPLALLIAVISGGAALYGVHFLMKALYKLRHDGTVRIERTRGRRGIVYVPIPGGNSGAGKVQFRTQSRIKEYEAFTKGPEKLPTGTRVIVTDIISPTTVEVAPITEPGPDGDA